MQWVWIVLNCAKMEERPRSRYLILKRSAATTGGTDHEA